MPPSTPIHAWLATMPGEVIADTEIDAWNLAFKAFAATSTGTPFLTFKAIKTRSETRTIPVILLTATPDPKSMMEGSNVGARYYITKPFQIEDLVTKVAQALESDH